MEMLAEIPSVGAGVPCENSRSSFLEAMHGGAGAAIPLSARLQEDQESKAVYGTGPCLEGRRGEEADPESGAAALSMVAGFIADGSSCMQASAAEQLAGEPSGTTGTTGVSAPVVPLVVPDGEVLAGHGGKLPGSEEQDREGETRSGGMMLHDVCAEDETGQETASDKEEDVLHLEGIIDDEASLLPAGEQNNEDCSDDRPPALDHLNLTASAAVFGGDETSSAVSEEDGAHASSMGSENGDELQDDHDEDRMAAEGEGVSGEMLAEEECNSEMLSRVWMEKFARLEAFKSEHGHPHVRLDEPLGAWVLVQRQKLKQGRLSPERELMLREIGFCFDGKQALELRSTNDRRAGVAPSQSARQRSCESTPRRHACTEGEVASRSGPRDAVILPWRVRREQERESPGGQPCLSPPRPRAKACEPGHGKAAGNNAEAQGGDLKTKTDVKRERATEALLAAGKDVKKIKSSAGIVLPARSASLRHSELWRQRECEKVNDMASKLMEGLVLQALSGSLNKKRGREGWLTDLRNALRSERKGIWRTDKRRVCQLLRSLEANLPWRTMDPSFHEQRGPLLDSIKEIETASDVFMFLRTLTAFTKVDGWREGYRSTRSDIAQELGPSASREAPCDQTAPPHGTKRQLHMSDADVGDTASSSVSSCPPSPPHCAQNPLESCGEKSLNSSPKRRKLAASYASHVGQEGMHEWLAGVGLAPDVLPLVSARLADEEWGVRNPMMLCALNDDEVEEMLVPIRDATSARMIISSVRTLRPRFFAHASALLSRGSPPGKEVLLQNASDKGAPRRSQKSADAGRRRSEMQAEGALWRGKTSVSEQGGRRHAEAGNSSRRERNQRNQKRALAQEAGFRDEKKLEEIRGKKMTADGTVLYLAHWQGTDSDDDTWEHAAGLGSDEWLVSEWEAEQAALRKPNISLKA